MDISSIINIGISGVNIGMKVWDRVMTPDPVKAKEAQDEQDCQIKDIMRTQAEIIRNSSPKECDKFAEKANAMIGRLERNPAQSIEIVVIYHRLYNETILKCRERNEYKEQAALDVHDESIRSFMRTQAEAIKNFSPAEREKFAKEAYAMIRRLERAPQSEKIVAQYRKIYDETIVKGSGSYKKQLELEVNDERIRSIMRTQSESIKNFSLKECEKFVKEADGMMRRLGDASQSEDVVQSYSRLYDEIIVKCREKTKK